jgi:hypothetical protein
LFGWLRQAASFAHALPLYRLSTAPHQLFLSWYSPATRANPDFLPITVLTVSSIYIKYKYTVIGGMVTRSAIWIFRCGWCGWCGKCRFSQQNQQLSQKRLGTVVGAVK